MQKIRIYLMCLVILLSVGMTSYGQEIKPEVVSYSIGDLSFRYIPQKSEKYGEPYGIFISYKGTGVIEGSSFELHSPDWKKSYWHLGKNTPQITSSQENGKKIFIITEVVPDIKYTHIQRIEISENKVVLKWSGELSSDSSVSEVNQEVCLGKIKTTTIAGCEVVKIHEKDKPVRTITGTIPFDTEEAKESNIVGWKNCGFTKLIIKSRIGNICLPGSVILGPITNEYSKEYPSYFWLGYTTTYKPRIKREGEEIYEFNVNFPTEKTNVQTEVNPQEEKKVEKVMDAEKKEEKITSPLLSPSDLIFCAGNQLWQKEDASQRIPILVVNNSDFFQVYPVELEIKNLPSITLVDQAGFEVLFQKKGDKITFISEVNANSWRAYYIYLLEHPESEKNLSMLTETKYDWIVDTGRIKVKFLKRPTGTFGPLYFISSGEKNLLSNWHSTFQGYYFWGAHSVVDGEILEEGPVKVIIGYPKGKPNMFFTIYRGLPLVIFQTVSGEKKVAQIYLDLYEDTPTKLVYPAKNEIKTLDMVTQASGQYRSSPTPVPIDIQGNWAYFKGDKGSIGFLFNRKTHEVNISDMTNIQTINFSCIEKNKLTEGIILADTDPSIYAEKLNYPLNVYQLNLQKKNNIPLEKTPDYHKDFIIAEFVNNTWGAQSRIHYETKDEIHKLKLFGVNQIQLCFANYYFWKTDFPENWRLYDSLKDIIDISHQYKVAVGGDIRPHYDEGIWAKKKIGEPFYFESEKWRQEYLAPKIKELCAYPLDALFLADESGVSGDSLDFKKKFKQRYGYDCPEIKDWKEVDISDEKIINRLSLMSEEYTNYCHWCNEEIRKYKSGMKTWVNQSSGGQWPGGWAYPWTYIDAGKVFEVGTDMSIDPYFSDTNRRRYEVRYLNAANHNKGVLTIPGDTSFADPQGVGRQIFLHSLFGGKGFCLFTVSQGSIETKPDKIQNYYYQLLWKIKNNIGNYLMEIRPVRFIAIPWSRDSWYSSLKEGGKLKQYWASSYDESILNLAHLYSLQWEYLFEEDIPDEIKKYPVVIVPEDKHLSEKMMNQLIEYTKGGGNLIIYGNLIEEKNFQKLLGIENVILDKKAGVIEGEKNILIPETYLLRNLPSEIEVLEKIKKSSGVQPVIISKKINNGRIFYFGFDLDKILKSNQPDTNYLIEKIVSSQITPLVKTNTLFEPILFQGKDYYLLGIHNTGSEKIISEIKIPIFKNSLEVFDLLGGVKISYKITNEGLTFFDKFNGGEIKFYRLSPVDRFPEYTVISTKETFLLKLEHYQSIGEQKVAKEEINYLSDLKNAHQNNKICVGIVETPVKTADVLLESLKEEKDIFGIKIAPVDITPLLLENLDVLVFEASLHGINSIGNWADAVKNFVKDGGGVLLTHGAVGGLWFSPLTFPDVGKGIDKVIENNAIPTKEGKFLTSTLSSEKSYKHPYYDHFVLIAGSDTSIPILRDEQNRIIFLTGIEGKGKVALSGFLFGLSDDGIKIPPSGWVKEFFIKTIKWLGTKK